MIEPTLYMAVGAATVGLMVAFNRNRRLRAQLEEAESLHSRLQADLEKRSTNLEYYQERNHTLAQDRSRLEAERDRYAKIAATRTLPQPVSLPESARVLAPEWRERAYTNHPEVNLKRLAMDLEAFDGQELVMRVRLAPQGGWLRKLRAQTERIYAGTPERILEDLRCWLMDDDLRLVVSERDGVTWADPDSPLHFVMELDRVTEEQPRVHVHPVEVAVVETRVVERFVEQPVVIEVPTRPGVANTTHVQVGLSREEVLALFEVGLASKLAELGLDPETGPVQAATPEQRSQRAAASRRKVQREL